MKEERNLHVVKRETLPLCLYNNCGLKGIQNFYHKRLHSLSIISVVRDPNKTDLVSGWMNDVS